MDETVVLADAGFLSKLSKYFGNDRYLKYDLIEFSKNLAKKQGLICKKIFYYNAPPFQSDKPSLEESNRFRNYERFIKKLKENSMITIREGRCQRLKINDKFIYKQKAVDSLMIIDLMRIPINYVNIRKIILIASDSDFVPAVNSLRELCIKTILYTYYEKGKRGSLLSTSNEFIKSVFKYVLLSKKDFENAPLVKHSGHKNEI
tara:strand:- start:82 stop:693 length:612 start_codon:yes stop_codon:yes gene_type:complete